MQYYISRKEVYNFVLWVWEYKIVQMSGGEVHYAEALRLCVFNLLKVVCIMQNLFFCKRLINKNVP